MRNLLKTLDYVPEIMSDVLGMIFDHLIQIDVRRSSLFAYCDVPLNDSLQVENQVDLDDVEDENEDDSFTEDDDEVKQVLL